MSCAANETAHDISVYAHEISDQYFATHASFALTDWRLVKAEILGKSRGLLI